MTIHEIIKENEELQLKYTKAIDTITILEQKVEKLQKENERLKRENRKLRRQRDVLLRAIKIASKMNKEKQDVDINKVIQLLKDVERTEK
jgi:FtsZ-binding cell division protein ZapB